MEDLLARLKALGITLPEAPKPLAAYIPAVRERDVVYTSGQLPLAGGELKFPGKVGAGVTAEEAKEAARLCAINCLSAAVTVMQPHERVERILKLNVFVNSAPGFTGQPEVANGASQLMLDIFGDKGKHARAAVGVAELPRNACVEIEMVLETYGDMPF